MSEMSIECPHCHESFELTEAIASPLVAAERRKAAVAAAARIDAERAKIEAKAKADAAAEYEAKLKASEEALAARDRDVEAAKAAELAARQAKAAAEQAKRDVELEVARRVSDEQAKIEARAKNAAEAEAKRQLRAIEDELATKNARLKEAEAAELAARRLKTEAEEAKRQADLQLERRLDEERAKIREQTARERDEEFRLKAAEKDKQLDALRAQIEDLNRLGASRSQPLIGEVLEADTLDVLKAAFPNDRIERVRRGHKGCDVVQTVLSPSGLPCGSIAWETKRTRAFQDGWLAKLREDQREVHADVAVLATETLPTGITTFEEREGVWVTSIASILPIAAVLRRALLDIATARRAGALADSTKERVFGYLTSSPFKQRVTGMIEAYQELRGDLDREKRTTATAWNKREKQLDRMVGGLAGLYGDLQGIVGPSLPAVEGLALPAADTDEGARGSTPALTLVPAPAKDA